MLTVSVWERLEGTKDYVYVGALSCRVLHLLLLIKMYDWVTGYDICWERKITMGEVQKSKEWGGRWSVNERLHALMSCLFDLGVWDKI